MVSGIHFKTEEEGKWRTVEMKQDWHTPVTVGVGEW